MKKLIVIFLWVIFLGCDKNGPSTLQSGAAFVDVLTQHGPWHLVVAKNSNPAIPVYNGTASDSIHFVLSYDFLGNMLLDSMYTHINGKVNAYSTYYSIGRNDNPGTSGHPYDTLFCNPPWKIGYSDTLLAINFNTKFVVFQIRSIDGSSIETDSLINY